ncbi:methylated-DNA--[protein]-cysteine S-methyltransferase [Hellea sp.]|nr:methylated-DNA--[protein]-cysteine S-methyltransferase [Hellea sp.]MDA8889068.1 methylated-DNA--[protein]-cysteine S-methyltransferase [Hellea sp.]MDB4844103.1 methylated-DNA--[protein]-cysteine S-methyltransferase [Hellea sp.]MDC1061959.1 methylated-DNA--[protein]-cysteine S-methyltransferase [Hellea sp.]MDC1088882.1 methylated-DNA--[protein]-cysteine S-methyltransferase [Hellea sp.]
MENFYKDIKSFNAINKKRVTLINDLTTNPLYIEWIPTPIGKMLAICDENHLYMLEFIARKNIHNGFQRLSQKYNRHIISGRTSITQRIEDELELYFKKALKEFTTPLIFTGTKFQKKVWLNLTKIPAGRTCSYSELAAAVGNKKASRAVANSNANNILALVVPCHRVILQSRKIGGYAGGIEKKEWLLCHEKLI